ncbi:MAG: inducible mutagenesis protein A [Roseibium sp.]|nr:inducible mutagenesis protein A [Roseibium sp.]
MHRASQDRADQRAHIAELRRRIAALEGRLPSNAQFGPAPAFASFQQGPAGLQGAGPGQDAPGAGGPVQKDGPLSSRLAFGVEAVDGLFQAGGVALCTLHEVVGAHSRDAGAVSGFALALLACAMARRSGHILWVAAPDAVREQGRFHGPGLCQFGVDPGRIVAVFPRRMDEALWALEEGARCSALAGVIGEVQGDSRLLGLTATRRLLLRAQEADVPVFLVRHGVADAPTAALTRWCVTPRPSKAPALSRQGPHEGLGRPGWQVSLTRNRDGRPGRADLEWAHAARQFSAPARSLALVSRSSGGPDHPPAERLRAARGTGG